MYWSYFYWKEFWKERKKAIGSSNCRDSRDIFVFHHWNDTLQHLLFNMVEWWNCSFYVRLNAIPSLIIKFINELYIYHISKTKTVLWNSCQPLQCEFLKSNGNPMEINCNYYIGPIEFNSKSHYAFILNLKFVTLKSDFISWNCNIIT